MKFASLFVLLVFLSGCASTPAPAPQPPPAAPIAAREPEPPGYLGFGYTYTPPDPEQGSAGWIMVRHVAEDGPAYRAGLQPQSVITAINGRPLDVPDQMGVVNMLSGIRPGDTVRLTLAGHNAKELAVVAAEMPPDKLRLWKSNFEPARPKRSGE